MAFQPKHSPIRQNVSNKPKNQENSNPNLTSPPFKSSPSSSFRGSKTIHKSASKNPTFVSPKKKIKERKFVVAKKNNPKKPNSGVNCKCKDKINGKCLCVAYENLRASQDDFCKSRGSSSSSSSDTVSEASDRGRNTENEMGICEPEEGESPKGLGLGSSTMKRRRDLLLEEARESVPESGKVLHLVKAFERLLTLPKKTEQTEEENEKNIQTGIKWALPGLQQQQESPPTPAFCPGEYSFTAESLGFDNQASSSVESSRGSSTSSRRSRRRSGSKLQQKQEHRVTSLRPFKLRTEQRGKAKEEEFVKKLEEMVIEEEKQRIPVAQGLPWTTDEPECLVKPPVKEVTRAIDLKLHSDVRAVERAEFDCQVAEKMTLIEQYKMEKQRQQKLEEEEEIRRLRKELVPKAQPMPYFDRPFIPRRSVR
ncbi:microtubule-destabilizing protein 60-like [Silene latifolia]|uniref:microtubule-destabilizing protein 60-like n=1 Tax=Silene latifolia TaxID=37657 RepID=UPI003D76C407